MQEDNFVRNCALAVTAAVVCLIGIILILMLTLPGYNRYQKRANAENQVKVTAIQIKNQEQRVQIAKQHAQIRYETAKGIREAQDEISNTLTPLYVQHEMIDALRESHATTVYIPTDPATGLPVVTTRNVATK